MTPILIFALAAPPDLAEVCAPVIPGIHDPETAQRYAVVGDAERAVGELATAGIAYRRALALDAAHGPARRALDEICGRRGTASSAHGQAAAREEAAGLRHLHAGIARYQEGDFEGARPLLERAASDPLSAPAAHFFLGLIALRQGAGGAAARSFARAEEDAAYRDLAGGMRRMATRTRRVSLLLAVQPEYDTNVTLLPDAAATAPAPEPTAADFGLLSLASLGLRPFETVTLRSSLLWRRQRTLTDYDLLAHNTRAGLEIGRRRHRAGFRYDLDLQWLGGAAYLTANQGTAEYRYVPRATTTLGVRYSLRHRDFRDERAAAFTGSLHAVTAEVTRTFGRGATAVAAGLVGFREQTTTALLSNAAGGGQLVASWRALRSLRAAAVARGVGARYDAGDALDRRRHDFRFDGSLELELDLHDVVSVIGGLDATINTSSIEDFRYRKIVTRLGLAGHLGWP
jgi:hypothetical protein